MYDEEFFRVVRICLEQGRKWGVPVQIGCGGTDTRSFLRRAEYAAEQGAAAVQVIWPYYVKLTVAEAVGFFEEVARACGEVPLVHYNTGYAKLTLEAEDYVRLAERVGTLIGTKLVKGDPLWFANVCEKAVGLSHFSGEYTLAADCLGGARGIYSWLAVTNPGLAVRWFAACEGGQWDEAMRIQRLVNLYKIHVKQRWAGQSNAAVNKADGAVNPNIRCGLRVRGPYGSCLAGDVEDARGWARGHFPELVELG